MIGRLFWMALGAAAGVMAVRKVTNAAKAYSPEGLAGSLTSVGEGLREIAAVVRESMAERETELRLALGVDEGVMDAGTAQALIDNPTSPRPADPTKPTRR